MPDAPTPAPPQSGDQPPEPQAAAPNDTPPWGKPEDFDPDKAWKLIQGLRSDKEQLQSRPVLDDTAKQRLAEYDALIEASKSDLERANEEATRWQTETERWRNAAVAARVQALAAGDFADPSDAVSAVDSAKYLTAGGEIDEDAIRRDLTDVLERKPHWRRQDATPAGPRLPAPNPAQGTSAGTGTVDPREQFGAIISGALGR